MNDEDWNKYLVNEENKYKKLGNVKCPAFLNEEIYFNDYGLNHILYKDRIPRPRGEVIIRFNLLIYVPSILRKTKTVDNEEKSFKKQSTAYFWTVKHRINDNLCIRIILRRLNNETIHFFSIMKE